MEGKILFEAFQSFELWKGLKRLEWQLEIAPKKRPTIDDQLSTIFSKFAHQKKRVYHVR